jgi:hypothetical protein
MKISKQRSLLRSSSTALLKKGVKQISIAQAKRRKTVRRQGSNERSVKFFSSSRAEICSHFSIRLDFLFLLHQGKRKINTTATKQLQAILYLIDKVVSNINMPSCLLNGFYLIILQQLSTGKSEYYKLIIVKE